MANSRYLVLILGLVVALAALPACSLLKTDSEEISSDEVPAVDAATDAVPEASAEVPPPTDALADTATPTEPPPIAENVPTDPALGAPAGRGRAADSAGGNVDDDDGKRRHGRLQRPARRYAHEDCF